MRIFKALLSNPLAIITSKNVLLISFANFILILKLQATTPPNALIGSLSLEFLKDKNGDLFEETPHGLACLLLQW